VAPETSTADPAPATRTFVLLDEEEGEEGECDGFEEGEEEAGEEGLEEGEAEEETAGECEEEARASRLPPSECRLRSARARVVVHSARDRIGLVIRYTSFAPAEVRVGHRLAGPRGSLSLRR